MQLMEVKETLRDLGISLTDYQSIVDAHPVLTENLCWAARFIRYCQDRGLNPAGLDVIAKAESTMGRRSLKIVPTIGAYRKIAHGTGRFAGMDPAEVGPIEDFNHADVTVKAPAYVSVTVYVMVDGHRCPVTATEYWREAVVLDEFGRPCSHWLSRPIGQLTVRTESQALRKAFSLCDLYCEEEQEYIESQRRLAPTGTNTPQDSGVRKALDMLSHVRTSEDFGEATEYCERLRGQLSASDMQELSQKIREAMLRVSQQYHCDDVPV